MSQGKDNIWNMDYVAPKGILRAGQRVLIKLEENTYPVEGTVKALASHLVVDVELQGLPQGFLPPLEGDCAEFSFMGRDCVYRFWADFLQSSAPGCLRWLFVMPDKLLQEQKRRFIRVPVQMAMRISMMDLVGAYDTTMHTEVVDVSRGGICFLTPRPVTLGRTLFIILEQLPEIGDLPVLGDVVRCQDIASEMGEPCWRAAVSLEKHMSEEVQDKLQRALKILQRQKEN